MGLQGGRARIEEGDLAAVADGTHPFFFSFKFSLILLAVLRFSEAFRHEVLCISGKQWTVAL